MKKKCSRCELRLSIKHFRKNRSRYDRLAAYCIPCEKLHQRKWYERNKKHAIAKASKRNKVQRRILIDVCISHLLNHPCVDCGETDIRVLDFDHVRGKKKFSICVLQQRSVAVATLLLEIEKCVIRCANCHRKKTAKVVGWIKHQEWLRTQVVRDTPAKRKFECSIHSGASKFRDVG